MRYRVLLLAAFVLASTVASANATPFLIDVHSARYSSALQVTNRDSDGTLTIASRTTN
jgi:hypothetical protein